MSKIGSIVHALMRREGRENSAFSFEPRSGHPARTLNSAFLISLAGASHPAFDRAGAYLDEMSRSPEWKEAASLYIEGKALIEGELEEARRNDPGFAARLDRLSEWATRPGNLADARRTAEEYWAVFFPEATGISDDRQGHMEALRSRRRVTVTRLNPSPLAEPAAELLFSSNVLLTVPPATKPLDAPALEDDMMAVLGRAAQEPQLFWYDHPIPLGVDPEENEILHGLQGLEEALEFEQSRGRVPPGARPVCILSASVTHGGLRDLARKYIREVLARHGGLKTMDLYAFTEADTGRIIAEVLGPALQHYLGVAHAGQQIGVFGVDGEYGRHYSFLKAMAAFWHVLLDRRVRATFKIDLDQVFPQRELVAETGASAFEHFRTPLWGAQGSDARGKPVELGLIAGALVNAYDIERSLYSCDVAFPDRDPSFDEFFFFSPLPQALSTEAEMMARYDRSGLDGRAACLQRIHVTGGTNGILVDSLRRHRPFTPSFIGRAEDQAYILSALGGPGPRLAYLHKDGLIMRHDKDVFAVEAQAAAHLGKIVGDLIRTLYFSAYARVVTDDVRALKELIDPFTGCFVSFIPATVVHLRFAFMAASFFARGGDPQGTRFVREGAGRIRKALGFVRGEDSALRRAYLRERSGWDLFYEALSAVEKALEEKDPFALDLQRRARTIIEDCKISFERRP